VEAQIKRLRKAIEDAKQIKIDLAKSIAELSKLLKKKDPAKPGGKSRKT
jgi:hypothetical protein